MSDFQILKALKSDASWYIYEPRPHCRRANPNFSLENIFSLEIFFPWKYFSLEKIEFLNQLWRDHWPGRPLTFCCWNASLKLENYSYWSYFKYFFIIWSSLTNQKEIQTTIWNWRTILIKFERLLLSIRPICIKILIEDSNEAQTCLQNDFPHTDYTWCIGLDDGDDDFSDLNNGEWVGSEAWW